MLDTPVGAIPESLLREGTAMWRALVDDVAEWADVRTPVDPRLSLPASALTPAAASRIEPVVMQPCTEPWAAWIAAARDCDMALVIAPETNGLLTKGVALMRAAGIEVLAPTGAAIGLTADKWSSAKWLHHNNIAHPDTWALERHRAGSADRQYTRSRPLTAGRLNPVFSDSPNSGNAGSGYLVKPRDGCGAMSIRRYDELEQALASMTPDEITQTYWAGRGASVLVIASAERARVSVLPAVWQNLEVVPHQPSRNSVSTSHFVYQGGSGPLANELQLRAHALTSRVLQALPGKVSGFVGIDLVLGDDANHDAVIEINPRLTTSYIGLRQMTDENLTRRLFGTPDHAATIQAPVESVHWNLHCVVAPQQLGAP